MIYKIRLTYLIGGHTDEFIVPTQRIIDFLNAAENKEVVIHWIKPE